MLGTSTSATQSFNQQRPETLQVHTGIPYSGKPIEPDFSIYPGGYRAWMNRDPSVPVPLHYFPSHLIQHIHTAPTTASSSPSLTSLASPSPVPFLLPSAHGNSEMMMEIECGWETVLESSGGRGGSSQSVNEFRGNPMNKRKGRGDEEEEGEDRMDVAICGASGEKGQAWKVQRVSQW
ncbi:hypothetical protein HDU79_008964 [Rhizoclosmatium sp. JEL0117]|nr:hypothetical protein HDU79_008964 [Rhizoclosmatium sp. JEL0117]